MFLRNSTMKIKSKTAKNFVFNLLTSAIMSLVMSFVLTWANIGWVRIFFIAFLKSFVISLIVSMVVSYTAVPLVAKLLNDKSR